MGNYKCLFCSSEMTPISDEHDYQRWECRGGDHSGMMPEMGCGAFLEKRKENDWKKEWKKKTDI